MSLIHSRIRRLFYRYKSSLGPLLPAIRWPRWFDDLFIVPCVLCGCPVCPKLQCCHCPTSLGLSTQGTINKSSNHRGHLIAGSSGPSDDL
jgi:hypothetical protein